MFKYLLKFIKFAGKQRKHMIIALVFGLLQSVFTAFSLLATAYALQNMIEGTANMSTVWSAFGIVGGGVLLAAVCNYFSTQFLTYAGYTIAANARIRIADKLKYAPMGYFNEHNLGQIANTATNTAARQCRLSRPCSESSDKTTATKRQKQRVDFSWRAPFYS